MADNQVDAPPAPPQTPTAAVADAKKERDPALELELDEPVAPSTTASSGSTSCDASSEQLPSKTTTAATEPIEPEAAPAIVDSDVTAVTATTTMATTATSESVTTETTTTTVTTTVTATTSETLAAAPSDDAPLQLSDLVLQVSDEEDDDDDEERFADARQENDGDSDNSDDDDSLEHELQDFYAEPSALLDKAPSSQPHASVPTTLSYSVNEMEVITNRGGRSGSLSKFLDDSDSYRRRSLQSFPDDPLFGSGLHHKSMSLAAFLDMGIDPILEILEDTDSDIRLWLMQPATVKDVIAEFITPPVFAGEPHEEYGYYKKHFVCSEIIMKLYTGEEDLYESFSSDSSSGSTATNAVFGCQDAADIAKWAQLYAIFDNPTPLDEMQLLFFSKALVRLHDGFCLEEGYVSNVLKRFLPTVVPHLYSNTVKYMLTLILQSYESVHPITGRNDAMEIVAPLLAEATRVDRSHALNATLVENTSHLLVDMLQANQADRLGSFCRREGGVYLSKYFVRDQFGTIRGFESMTHGYHNFLQYMLLEELGKHPAIVDELFTNAFNELTTLREHKISEASSSLNVHMATELLLLCAKYHSDAVDSDESNQLDDVQHKSRGSSFGYGSFSPEQFASSPRESATETSMYNLATLGHGQTLWSSVLRTARTTAHAFIGNFDCGLAPSVEIALAKYLHALVALNDEDVNEQLHVHHLVPKYLRILAHRSHFDMLLIHVVPAVSFILRDADGTRAKNCPLTKDLFGVDAAADSDDDSAMTIVDLILHAKLALPSLRIYSAIIHDVLDEVFATMAPSQNNAQVLFHCKRSSSWAKLTGRTSSRSDVKPRGSDTKRSSDESDTRRSSLKEQTTGSSPPAPAPVATVVDPADDERLSARTSDKLDTSASSARGSDTSDLDADANGRSSSESSTRSDKQAHVPPPPPPPPVKDVEKDTPRKSTHYFKNVLQSPVFKSPMRLGSVIKVPEKTPSPTENGQDQAQPQARGTFAWNSVFKKLRNSWVANHHHSDKGDKKLLALSNEPFAHAMAPRQTDVLVVDTSRGDDVTKLVHADAGVVVTDVPVASAHYASSPSSHSKRSGVAMNVLTSGYMYKNKLPETGQRHVWERYYFVLNRVDGSLSYYISEAHAKDRTYVRGTARPVSVSEGLPIHVTGQHSVYGFQINTQGHGAFMVLVDSIDTRLVWLTEILVCVNASAPPSSGPSSSKRLSLLGDDATSAAALLSSSSSSLKWSKAEMKDLVVDLYKNLFGPHLKFSTPLEAPASFWMEEKIDPVAESCVLSSNLPDCVPYWGEFHGYKRLCDYWKIRDETVERSSGRVLRVVVDEDEETAVVMTSTTFRILRNSQIVTEESCDILSMSGGAIVSIHCTFDSYRIAEAFRKEGISAS